MSPRPLRTLAFAALLSLPRPGMAAAAPSNGQATLPAASAKPSAASPARPDSSRPRRWAPYVSGVTLRLDLAARADSLRPVIDFFNTVPPADSQARRAYLDLRPRHVVGFISRWHGTPAWDSAIRSGGLEPIHNLHAVDGRDSARELVRRLGKLGPAIWQLWSEPNRTWGSRAHMGDDWLRTARWEDFLERAADICRGVKDADPRAPVSGPVLSGDAERDSLWKAHLYRFLEYWVAHKLPLDYLSFNPPEDPDQVLEVATAAKRYAAAHPELGLKGIGLGEYPFYRDWPSLHLRFFVAFAEAGNVAYAGRSDYMDSPTNSGLVFSDGRKKPLYWVFHAYARMRGRRVPAEKKGRHRAIQALATLDEGARRLEILLGNDQNTDEEVTLLLPGAPGPAKLAVQAPAEAGWTPISTAEAAKADTLKLPALAVPAKGVLRLLVDFPGKDPFPAAKPPAIAPAK